MVIYRHIRKDTNEVFYIGIGDAKRPYITDRRNPMWTHITNKTEYDIEIIEEGLTWEKACKCEIELIRKYGRRDKGNGTLVNMTDGGEGWYGNNHSEKSKRKISKSKIENYKNPKLREKLSKIHKERLSNPTNNAFYGKSHTPESIEKMKTARMEYLQNNDVWNKGIPMANETRTKLSESLKNQNKIKCPHCGKIGNPGNMKYWHFDNCKKK